MSTAAETFSQETTKLMSPVGRFQGQKPDVRPRFRGDASENTQNTCSERKCTFLKGTWEESTGLTGGISPNAARQVAGRHHQEGFSNQRLVPPGRLKTPQTQRNLETFSHRLNGLKRLALHSHPEAALRR